MQNERRNPSKMYKAISLLVIVLDVLVIVFATLQFLAVWDGAINVFVPLLGAINLCQAYLQWKSNRIVSYLSIAVAVCIFIISLAVFLL